jgi:hypothetical protein
MLLPPPSQRILRLSHLYSTTTRSYHRRHHHHHHHSIFQSQRPPSIIILGNTITTNNLVMTGRSYDGRISPKCSPLVRVSHFIVRMNILPRYTGTHIKKHTSPGVR